ncbi:MAG: S-layer homology domain-containing protein [Halanaerobiales bacterium]
MVMAKKTIYILTAIILLFSLINISPARAKEPVDIDNHWAQDYILNTVNRELFELYPDSTFRPEQPITRGEFARGLARQLGILEVNETKFQDLNGYPGFRQINGLVNKEIISGYPDGTFKPEKKVTRVEIITLLIKSLGIKSDNEMIKVLDNTSFPDLAENHWAINYAKIAGQLGILQQRSENRLNPNQYVTRAEAARYLAKAGKLNGKSGYMTDIYPSSQRISVNLNSGERKIYNYSEETLLARNNRIVDIDAITKTDKVFLIADENDNVKYLKGYGMVTEDDLATEVSRIAGGIIDPEEVKQLSSGDLEILKPTLIKAVEKQLENQGLSRKEIESIMNTEWDELEELSKERLAEAVAIQTGLPLDITKSLLGGDWEKIKTYAQIEIVQRIVQKLLEADLLS